MRMQTFSQTSASHSYSASTSLLRRVKSNDHDAWRRLVKIYGPLVYAWARKSQLQPADAHDVVGVVFGEVVRSIDRFEKDERGQSFRRWLWIICKRRVINLREKNARMTPAGGSAANVAMQRVADEIKPFDEQDETDWLRQRVAHVLKDDFDPMHWQAFWRTVVEGEEPKKVAESLGMSVWSLYKARSRLVNRLRTELRDLDL